MTENEKMLLAGLQEATDVLDNILYCYIDEWSEDGIEYLAKVAEYRRILLHFQGSL